MVWLISKVARQKRSNLVWAVFENVALLETLDNLHTLDKFSLTFRDSCLQIIFKIGVLKIL